MAFVRPLFMTFSFFLLSNQANAETTLPTAVPATTIELQTSKPLSSTPSPTTPRGNEGSPTNISEDQFPNPAPPGIGSREREVLNELTPLVPVDSTDLDAICGTVVPKPSVLTTYGQSYQEGAFPWHAPLYHVKGDDLAYICGTSLISKSHVLTVAHCVTRRKSQALLQPDSLLVYLGKFYLKRFASPGIQDRKVSQILLHPQYNAGTFSNDIALVKLAEPAEITDYVRPVCLWQDSVDLSSVVDKEGSVVGWGFDETGKVTQQLMQTKMSVIPQEKCVLSFPNFYSRFTSDCSYCAAFRNRTLMCNGDSGSSMVFPKSSSTHSRLVWQLRGLVSVGVALQSELMCDSSHYAVFTDAAKYLDWIKESMQ